MASGRVSLALIMRLTVLVALNLALLRDLAWMLRVPVFFFIVAAINVVLVQAVVLGRPLGVFHAAFLILGTVFAIVSNVLIGLDPRPGTGPSLVLGTLIQGYRAITDDDRFSQFTNSPTSWEADCWVLNLLGLSLAWAGGQNAARVPRRRGPRSRGWDGDATAFFQGAVIGFGLFSIGTVIHSSIRPDLPIPQTFRWYAHRVGMAASPILAGFAVLYLSRSRRTGPQVAELGTTASQVGNIDNDALPHT